jgi:uncharacterized membrane protein
MLRRASLDGGAAMSEGETAQEKESFAPPLPGSTPEFINTVAHYYRGEIARMSGWRDRIDRTSNWAITVVAGMLSVSLSTSSSHHGVLLFAMLLVALMLSIEARRYRFFDVYRARVRRLERNYFAPVFDPSVPSRDNWAQILAADLRAPIFQISFNVALSRRLRRNYCWMYLILLLAWVLKISSSKLQSEDARFDFMQTIGDVVGNAALGPIPGPVVVLVVVLFYGWIAYATLRREPPSGELTHGNVHV